ncbi:MAG: DUF692 family multinuclear iron-containing protein [Myxococcota bacterium]
MIVPRSELPTGVGLGLRWAFIDEIAQGQAPASIQLLEVSPENYMRRGGVIPEALDRAAERFPILTHGLMMNVGGTTELDPAYLRQLRAFLWRMGARYHSDHLCWTGSDGAIVHDLLPLPHDRQAVRRCVEQIDRIQQALSLPFAVENISYYLVPGGGMAEVDFIGEVLEGADCGLLLDVNNVQVNADNHGFDPLGFLGALPLDRVVHLHVAGGQRRPHLDDLIIDTHGTDVCPRVQALMAWVVERLGPVPVIYERDHDIPPLPELGRQVAELREVYARALARHAEDHAEDPPEVPPVPPPRDPPVEIRSLAGIERGLSAVILDREGETGLPGDPAGWLCRHGVESPDHHALVAIGASRLLVYRSLVRAGLMSVVRSFIPRTIARLSEDGFVRVFDAWLHQAPPRSRYLRDAPGELVAWARTAWPADAAVDDYLVDLARLEILESEIDAAPDDPPPPDTQAQLVLDQPLVFCGALRIADFEHAVHTLPPEDDDRSAPPREPTTLLLYRDTEHEVRTLHLSPLARAVLRRLVEQGQTVAEALPGGATDAGETMDDAVLGRMSALLADLAERGILRGSGAAASPPVGPDGRNHTRSTMKST